MGKIWRSDECKYFFFCLALNSRLHRALDSLFSTLKTRGRDFPVEFWDTVLQELLFPIFAVLNSSQDTDMSRFITQEDISVWLQTTMIQALRDLIDLYTYHFDLLERSLDGLLDLLCVCICQGMIFLSQGFRIDDSAENDTLARLGTSCLQVFLEKNVKKFSATQWERVTTSFVKLFRTTTPHQLFDESLRVAIDNSLDSSESSPGTSLYVNITEQPPDPIRSESNGLTVLPAPLCPPNEPTKTGIHNPLATRRKTFRQIIVKCVLQLLLIEMINELLRNNDVYQTIPPDQLLLLMRELDHSYQFARAFNDDKELRTGLWKVGMLK